MNKDTPVKIYLKEKDFEDFKKSLESDKIKENNALQEFLNKKRRWSKQNDL